MAYGKKKFFFWGHNYFLSDLLHLPLHHLTLPSNWGERWDWADHSLRERSLLTTTKFLKQKMFTFKDVIFFKAPRGYAMQTRHDHTPEGGGVKGPKMQRHECSSIPHPPTFSFVGDTLLAGMSLEPRPGTRDAALSKSELCCAALGKGQPKRWLKLLC